MTDENSDLFGKIDALFEKRAPAALQDKGLEHEDFPVLTEVVADTEEKSEPIPESERRTRERRQNDRRLTAPPSVTAEEDLEQRVTAVEERLSDLFIRQQLRVEEAVRRAIREELGKTDL